MVIYSKLINENMYAHGRGDIYNFLNRLSHEFLGLTPDMILTVFFCNINIYLLLDKFPQKIIPYLITEWK
jgi:hypothetical protein